MAFDGFEDGDYTTNPTWNDGSVPGAGTIVVTTDAKKNGVYGVRFTTTGNADTGLLELYYPFPGEGISEATGNYYAWARLSDVNLGYLFYYATDNVEGFPVFAMAIMAGGFYWKDSTATWQPFDLGVLPAANTWYRLRATRIDANTINYYIYDSSDTVIDSALNKEVTGGAGLVTNTYIHLIDVLDTTISYTADFDDVSYSDTSEPPMAYFLFR